MQTIQVIILNLILIITVNQTYIHIALEYKRLYAIKYLVHYVVQGNAVNPIVNTAICSSTYECVYNISDVNSIWANTGIPLH